MMSDPFPPAPWPGEDADPLSNVFTDEIANVSEDDWTGVDSDLLWGAESEPLPEGDVGGPDLLA
jgi:hypothetical protein